MIKINHETCAEFAVCMLLSLVVVPLPAAGAKRNLDLTPCETQFETYRKTALVAHTESVAEMKRLSADPSSFVMRSLKEGITAAQTMSGVDFFETREGGRDPGAMSDFFGGLTLSEVRERQKLEKGMLAALNANDLNAYATIKGSRPSSPAQVAYLHAMSTADLCALNARAFQLTGKPNK